MKTAILSSVAGAAAGAFAMWLILSNSSPAGVSSDKTQVAKAQLAGENQKLSGRVQSLEKELAAAKAERATDSESPAVANVKKPVFSQHFDEGKMEEMMKQHAERDANREADKQALRLKLTPEQKESLRKFLLAEKERQRAMFSEARKNGGKLEMAKGQSKDDFLKSLLRPEQQAEYERSQEEQRTARAEEYAQRKVRKLNNDLSLSEEQKDKLFQAYAQQKLTVPDAAKNAEPGGDVTGPSVGGAISFSSVSVDGGGVAPPVEIEIDSGDFLPFSGGGGDLERETMQSILTPEQLAVYDQRKAEEQERMKHMRLESFPGAGGGGAVRIELKDN